MNRSSEEKNENWQSLFDIATKLIKRAKRVM